MINLYESYLHKIRKFGVNDSDRFRASYAEAYNLVVSELNARVFSGAVVDTISSFDDIIDSRLRSFTSLTFDDTDAVIGGREMWSVEYDLERKSTTNGFTDTIADDSLNVVISIANDVLTVAGDTVVGTLTLPTTDAFTLRVSSFNGGNSVEIDDTSYDLVYTTGTSALSQEIGTVSSHVINGVSGWDLTRTSFNSGATRIYDFLMNEGTGSSLVDEVSAYTITVVDPLWQDVYIAPSSGLNEQYRSVLDMGLDYHLQDGGEWAIEPEPERERKWYSRGISLARSVYQNNTTYVNPLGL